MTILRCVVAGCTSEFRTDTPCRGDARFICRFHTETDQLNAVGRCLVTTEEQPVSRWYLPSVPFNDLDLSSSLADATPRN